MIILKKFCFAVKLSRSSRLDSKCLSSPTVFPPFVCVYVCVCVITNQFPRVLSAVSSVCVWSVGERERESWNSGWNPRSLLVSLLSANQIKQMRVRRTNCREQERVCDHIQQLFYIRVCVCFSVVRLFSHFFFSEKSKTNRRALWFLKTMLCFII
jgi:hypothetical protein